MEVTLILVLLTAYFVAWFRSPKDNEKDTHAKDSHSSPN